LISRRVEETGPVDTQRFDADIRTRAEPIIIRGAAHDWPAVAAGRESDEALAGYLKRMDLGKPAEVLIGPPEIEGHFFYDDAMSGCNFQKRFGSLSGLLDKILSLRTEEKPIALYAGAAGIEGHLAGWAEQNRLPFNLSEATPRIWIGNRTRVATHFDETSNVAVVVSGRRRFTLFPPEQLPNLYAGPFHFTIAGPPVSMVDLKKPDLQRYPRFADALPHGRIADLEPGDALFIPPIWWHSVEALGRFNILVNYWWDEQESLSPLGALSHAILAVRDLPHAQRQALRTWFEHYVFSDDAPHAADHLPETVRGVMGRSSASKREAFLDHLRGALTEG
jgi:hypothetical protein